MQCNRDVERATSKYNSRCHAATSVGVARADSSRQSQLPNSAGADVSSTVVDIKIQPDRDVPIVIQGDEDSVRSEGMESK